MGATLPTKRLADKWYLAAMKIQLRIEALEKRLKTAVEVYESGDETDKKEAFKAARNTIFEVLEIAAKCGKTWVFVDCKLPDAIATELIAEGCMIRHDSSFSLTDKICTNISFKPVTKRG